SPVYVVIGLSGFTALGAEVLWTRLLSLILGANVYSFSIILAVFLVGLGAGGALGSLIARQTTHPKAALGYSQLLLAATTAWAAYTIARTMPYLPIDPWMATNPWFNFQVDLMRTAWTILPATILWGASFPLALAAAAVPGENGADLTGAVYAVNTAGAILGALVFTLILIPKLGTQNSERLLIAITAVSAVIMFAS